MDTLEEDRIEDEIQDDIESIKILDSKKILEKFKNKIAFWRPVETETIPHSTLDKRQQELWRLVKDSANKNGVKDRMKHHLNAEVQEEKMNLKTVAESANTFLTAINKDMENENNQNAPSTKITALDQSPLFDSRTPPKEGIHTSPVLVEKLTDKLQFKRTGLKKIQERLNKLANAKEVVAKNYNKLAAEITSWCSLCLERDSELELLTELQQVLAADKKAEQTMTRLLLQINKKLEYVVRREENMLQERKELNSLLRKYDSLRLKKGDQNMETQYLKENLVRKRTSLYQLTEQYYESLAKILREEFTRACFIIYDVGSDLKEATREFSLQSIDILKAQNDPQYIEKFLEDVRKMRADKQWSKLTCKERNDPTKLAEIVGNMYNGQDSLLRFASNKYPIKFSALPLHEIDQDTIEDMDDINPMRKLDLSVSISQGNNDKYNDFTTNNYMMKKSQDSEKGFAGKHFSRSENSPKFRNNNSHEMIHLIKDQKGNHPSENIQNACRNSSNFIGVNPSVSEQYNFSSNNRNSCSATQENIIENRSNASSSQNSVGDVVMKFGHELTNSFLEADHLLNTNAWD